MGSPVRNSVAEVGLLKVAYHNYTELIGMGCFHNIIQLFDYFAEWTHISFAIDVYTKLGV